MPTSENCEIDLFSLQNHDLGMIMHIKLQEFVTLQMKTEDNNQSYYAINGIHWS